MKELFAWISHGPWCTYVPRLWCSVALLHLRTSAPPMLPCCASQILFTPPSILLLPPVLLSETALNCDQLLFPCHSVASCILGFEDEVVRNRFLCCLAAVVREESTSATAL